MVRWGGFVSNQLFRRDREGEGGFARVGEALTKSTKSEADLGGGAIVAEVVDR